MATVKIVLRQKVNKEGRYPSGLTHYEKLGREKDNRSRLPSFA
jgi:hypothetical protein